MTILLVDAVEALQGAVLRAGRGRSCRKVTRGGEARWRVDWAKRKSPDIRRPDQTAFKFHTIDVCSFSRGRAAYKLFLASFCTLYLFLSAPRSSITAQLLLQLFVSTEAGGSVGVDMVERHLYVR